MSLRTGIMVGVTCPIEIMRRVTSEMQAWCKSRIAHFRTPRYFKFVGVFPMTVTGKMQKFKIREVGMEECSRPTS